MTNKRKESKRKLSSGANESHEIAQPIDIDKKYRKFTENIGEGMSPATKTKRFEKEMSTTAGAGTSKTNLLFKNRKESDLDGYAASVSMVSTPTMVNKVIRLNKVESPQK